MRIERLDHLVLTAKDLQATIHFYARVLGMEAVEFQPGRFALHFGEQKINLHEAGREFEPKARLPTPGSEDLCFVVPIPIDEVVEHVRGLGVTIEQGPVDRTGALGPMRSVYLRDPDGNLIEIASYLR